MRSHYFVETSIASIWAKYMDQFPSVSDLPPCLLGYLRHILSLFGGKIKAKLANINKGMAEAPYDPRWGGLLRSAWRYNKVK